MANLYIVSNGNNKSFVQAKSKTAAFNHVARKTISVSLASQEECMQFAKDGIEPEVVGAEAPPVE